MAFTESEAFGNLFMFIFAGYETSAITLHTALLMLACYPEIQSQLHAEIDAIWANKDAGDEWCYETDYPRMKVAMAVIVRASLFFVSTLCNCTILQLKTC